MNQLTVGISIVQDFIDPDFQERSIGDLWKACSCGMLWEAIRKNSCTIISRSDVLGYLQDEESVILIPEPLPAFFLGIRQTALQISTEILLSNRQTWLKDSYSDRTNCLLNIEPLYILSASMHWMIVLTTENTASGQQLCVLLKNQNE